MKDYSYARKVIIESQHRLARPPSRVKKVPTLRRKPKQIKSTRSIPVRAPLEEVFDSLCDKHSSVEGCWYWKGQTDRNGYATYGKRVYQLLFPEVEPRSGKYICHYCDNKLCVNPHHLYVGNASTNQEDRYKKTNASGKQRHENFLARKILHE